MAIVTTDNQHYADIAAAIREKNGEETLYKPSEMAAAILAIEGGSTGIPGFTYTGLYSTVDDGDGNWRIKFLSSGVLTLDESVSVDVFLVGGGASGSPGGGSGYNGGGGGAGYTTTQKGVTLVAGTEYEIQIGSGGEASSTYGSPGYDGGATIAFTLAAGGGSTGSTYLYGGNGGSGGAGGRSDSASGGEDGANGGGSSPYAGTGQGTTTREFGEESGTLYATGGDSGKASGSVAAGAANTGDGGDGSLQSGNNGVASGAGGSGIVVIRNARG